MILFGACAARLYSLPRWVTRRCARGNLGALFPYSTVHRHRTSRRKHVMSWKRTSALLCALAVMALPLPVAAQDDTLPFEGYTNEHAGLMAEVPAGWLQTSGG